MKRAVFVVAGMALVGLEMPAAIITQWDFNLASTDPAIGSGTVSAIGGTSTGSISQGSGYESSSNKSSDPVTPASSANRALPIAGFPSSATGNKTAGVQFTVSTVGYEGIVISWDQRHTDGSSRYARFQYTLDGSGWVDSESFSANPSQSGATWYDQRSVSLASLAEADGNPSFAFRIVSEFESTATGSGLAEYLPSSSSSEYGTSGTWRFDMVTVEGTMTPVPEPPTTGLLAVLFLGCIALARPFAAYGIRLVRKSPKPATGT